MSASLLHEINKGLYIPTSTRFPDASGPPLRSKTLSPAAVIAGANRRVSAMFRQLLFISAAFAGCVALHASAMILTIDALGPWLRHKSKIGNTVATMIYVVCCLGLFHFVEICLWAFVMATSGAIDSDDALYFAFSSYTTLGYGDILSSETQRLLGPASAMNGILLFGWSTAVIFKVMGEAYSHRASD